MALPAFMDRFGLGTREQRNATLAAAVLVGLFFVVLPLGLQVLAISKSHANGELRDTLQKVQAARNDIRARNARKDGIAQRYAKKAPPLAGFLEQTARAYKLDISDSNDRQELAHGKRYNERNTVVHLRKAGMLPLARFIEAIEQSGYAVSVGRLSIRKRSGEPNSYDVEIGVSAFDRSADAPKEKEKPKDVPK